MSQDPHESTKSDTLAIDDGYEAKYALVQRDMACRTTAPHCRRCWSAPTGSTPSASTGYLTMAGEVGSVAIAYEAYKIELLALTIEVFCERTERAFTAWQLRRTRRSPRATWPRSRPTNEALAQAQAAAGVVISGRNPGVQPADHHRRAAQAVPHPAHRPAV